ncbi:MAG: hypothetical protein R3C01_16315 [Planctomycetaceae bacterium]
MVIPLFFAAQVLSQRQSNVFYSSHASPPLRNRRLRRMTHQVNEHHKEFVKTVRTESRLALRSIRHHTTECTLLRPARPMPPHRCTHCNFIALDDAEPDDGLCPGCGEVWQTTLLSPLPASNSRNFETATEVAKPLPSHRSSFLLPVTIGLFLGAMLMFVGLRSAGYVVDDQTQQIKKSHRELLESVESLKAETVSAMTLRSEEAKLRREAERKLVNSEAETAMVRNELAEALTQAAKVQEQANETQEIINELEASLASARRSERQSYVRSWQILGPLPIEETGQWVETVDPKMYIVKKSYKPPKGETGYAEKMIRWKEYESPENQINLGAILATGDRVSCYLATFIYAEDTTKLQLSLGSDDGMAVWVNREKVHEVREARSPSPGQDKVAVTFRQGWNEVLVHVDNNGGSGWAMFFECRSEDGQRPFAVYATTRTPRSGRSATPPPL